MLAISPQTSNTRIELSLLRSINHMAANPTNPVNAKRCTFAQPTQVRVLGESVSDLDFVAED